MSPRLSELLQAGQIRAIPVLMGPRDQKNRLIFWTSEFEEWCCNVSQRTDARGIVGYGAQLNLAFAEFVAGRPLSSGLARCDPPKGQGIWKLKTPDLRLYGWADDAQCMVLAIGELKRVIKAPGPPKDRDLASQAVGIRRRLKLDWKHGERYELFPICGQ